MNNLYDVTIVPSPNGQCGALSGIYDFRAVPGACFDRPDIKLMKGRGQECIKTLCGCLTGNDSNFGCDCSPDWKKVQEWCGKPQTQSFYNDGAWFTRYPASVLNLPRGPQHIGPGVYSLGMYGS